MWELLFFVGYEFIPKGETVNKLQDAYEQYKSHGFILQQAVKNQKYSSVQGSYQDRVTDKWSEQATGYVAIIPESIIVVDADTYESDCMFDDFKKALGYEPEASVISTSGGEHYFFENKYPNMVVGKHEFKKVDIYAGYQSVVPIVGTKAINKEGEVKTYDWATFDEKLVINAWDDKFLTLLNMRERAERVVKEFDELEQQIKADDMSVEEVEELISSMSENLDYDTWLHVGMALYDRFGGSDEGYEYFNKFSKQSAEKYDEDFTYKKWHNGGVVPNAITYKRLRTIANECLVSDIKTKLGKTKSLDEIQEVLEPLKTKRVNCVGKKDNEVRDELIELASSHAKETIGKPEKVAIKKALRFDEPEKEVKLPDGFKVYRMDNKYLIRIGTKVLEDVSSTMLKETLSSFGIEISKDEFPKFKSSVKSISRYRRAADYTLPTEMAFSERQRRGTDIDELVCNFNPLIKLEDVEIDEEIVDDFFNKVWAGKLYDMVRLIGLTIKFKEQKLNRLMVIAPSNSGKSEIFTMLNFQKIHMGRLLAGMRGDKGVGKQVIDGLKQSELMLIDEANKSLEQDIKDLDKEVQLDQFGSGGTQIIPLQFTALTSTHSNATRNNSDELYNRFLQVELKKSEMKHTVTSGELFKADATRYTASVEAKLLQLLKETINGDYTRKDLEELQERYRLPLNNDLNELLFTISEDFISETKSVGSATGDVLYHSGKYYYKRKGDVYQYFANRLGEIESLDVGKYAELLSNHFVSQNAKSIKIDGKPLKYHEVSLTPFTEDEDELILSMFDDLDIEEL